MYLLLDRLPESRNISFSRNFKDKKQRMPAGLELDGRRASTQRQSCRQKSRAISPVRRFQTCKDDGGNVTRIAGHCISIHCTDDSDVNTKITLDLVERSIPLRNGRGSGRVNCKALPQSSASGKHPSLPPSLSSSLPSSFLG